MIQEIYIIDGENDLYNKLNTISNEENNFNFKNIKEQYLELALKNIPSLIIINEDTVQGDVIDICNKIHENDDNRITPVIVISSNIEDKSDCIFVHYNSINKSLANYIRENCLIAHKEMIDYLFYGRYSEFKNKSMIENFIKEERHRRERIKTIRKNITKKLKEKTTIVFDNNVILYNSHLMTRDIKYDNTTVNNNIVIKNGNDNHKIVLKRRKK